jgi:FAD linked oxidases, C-terminal domain/Cysteine-rich domain
VPPSRIAEMVDFIQEVAERYQLKIGTFGHAGDGNLHPTAVLDSADEGAVRRALAAFDEIFARAIELDGTITELSGVEDAVGVKRGLDERVLYPPVSRGARKLAAELAAPAAQGCCGALHAHNGELRRGEELAEELGEALPGTIVTTSGGCAAHLASVLGPERVKEFSHGWPSDRVRLAWRPRATARRLGNRPVAARGSGCRTLVTSATGWASGASRAS